MTQYRFACPIGSAVDDKIVASKVGGVPENDIVVVLNADTFCTDPYKGPGNISLALNAIARKIERYAEAINGEEDIPS